MPARATKPAINQYVEQREYVGSDSRYRIAMRYVRTA